MTETAHTFTCDVCGRTLVKGWSDEDARTEANILWGKIDPKEEAVVCDSCFQAGIVNMYRTIEKEKLQ